MKKFPSTTLPQSSDPKDNQRAMLDLLDKINVAVDMAAAANQQIIAGAGLEGGGPLTADVTVSMGTPSNCSTATPNNAAGTTHTHALTGVPPSTRTISAGVGLSGGGDLSADRTISMGTPSTCTDVTTNGAAGTTHQHALSGVVPTSRTITAGVGLSGGGNLSADRTVSMGTPSDCTPSTTNGASGTTHQHAITGFQKAHSVKAETADYTITDSDGYDVIVMTTGGAARTVTLPTLADNQGRFITVVKSDDTVYDLILDGEGAETINGFSSLRVGLRHQSITVFAAASEWKFTAGVFQPTTLEPELGNFHSIEGSTGAWFYSNTTPSAGTWYTVTFSGVPSGAVAIESTLLQNSSVTGSRLYARRYGSGLSMQPQNMVVGGAYGAKKVLIRVDSSYRCEVGVDGASMQIYVSYPSGYCLP